MCNSEVIVYIEKNSHDKEGYNNFMEESKLS